MSLATQRRLIPTTVIPTVLTAIALVATLAFTSPGAEAGTGRFDRWAPEATAAIHPGVMTLTKGSQCTANFVFTDARGNVYVGQAAHCAGTGSSTDTNGCDTGSAPLGTKVTFVDGGKTVGTGRLVYSSWITMRKLNTKAANACAYNDLALIKVDAAKKDEVNPTIPVWGGPMGIDKNGLEANDAVYAYAHSSGRGGGPLGPIIGGSLDAEGVAMTGTAKGDYPEDGGWSHGITSNPAGIPGDSGSGFVNGTGKAVGVLSTLSVGLPDIYSNQLGDVWRELVFARKHSGIVKLQLVRGTRAFDANAA